MQATDNPELHAVAGQVRDLLRKRLKRSEMRIRTALLAVIALSIT
jgi:hypothetical protein